MIGEDVKTYEALHEKIVETFRNTYPEYGTQTEHILAVQFGLAEDCQKTADALAQMIRNDGCQMRTGFVGTPYILHVLSNYGYTDLAYTLLCRKEYPSWLYAVGKGATTIWEHWDGIMENGEFWSTDMNIRDLKKRGSSQNREISWSGLEHRLRPDTERSVPGGRTQTVRFGTRL